MTNTGSRRLRPWDRWMRTPAARTIRAPLFVRTADGVELALHRFPSRSGRRKAPPVMLLHGLSANRLTFSFPGRSLAEYLSHHGFDCYVPELRGAGQSERPAGGWDLDDYLRLDLPAVLDEIRRDAQHDRVHWVGHSMGGILMLAHLMEKPGDEIVSGLALGSALDYSHGTNAFTRLQHLLPLVMRIGTVPWGTILHCLSPAAARFSTPLETLNFCMENIEPDVLRRVYANAFEPIPARLLRSLATTFEPRGLHNRDSSVHYLEQTDRVRAPICLVGGSRDVQCPLHAVRATADLLDRAEVRVAPFGREHGHRADYGHFDLILGRYAPAEVWPLIVDWLRGHP